MERFLENAIYASRWLLAPVYFGLSLGLIALIDKIFSGDIPHTAAYLQRQRVGSDSDAAFAGRYDAGGRAAGDGDVFRL